MVEINGTVKVVSAKNAILFEENDKQWFGPDFNYGKTLKHEELVLMKGHKVKLETNETGFYTSIVNLDIVKKITEKPSTDKAEPEKVIETKQYQGVAKDSTYGKVLSMDEKIRLGQCINLVYAKLEKGNFCIDEYKKDVKELFAVTGEIVEEVKNE